ncbi:uncharacterized protein LAESUDRAFT_324889 [Laetiporus sulphureus 93-53]|uniref:Uncharacterized protein n=1 Tax=Laetiporus sulphureus 93-53 TaxID=1314785 RepID=A0A165CYW8_9APHY|nr:uncharacterized protein LAESUDRAFT_324889 [Laetiporus sulphureus 93-53]KZT03775.1 hypothetical protein LAESUDRAFT_324889 [Laetiporus sulphureus 93-53]
MLHYGLRGPQSVAHHILFLSRYHRRVCGDCSVFSFWRIQHPLGVLCLEHGVMTVHSHSYLTSATSLSPRPSTYLLMSSCPLRHADPESGSLYAVLSCAALVYSSHSLYAVLKKLQMQILLYVSCRRSSGRAFAVPFREKESIRVQENYFGCRATNARIRPHGA